jgi:hypothetical protein
LPLQSPPVSVDPLQMGVPHRPCGSACPDLTGRQTPLLNPVSDAKQLWHDDRHDESQQMPATQYIEVQSVETWQTDPSPREPCARAAGAAKAMASSAQTAARLKRTVPDVLPASMIGTIQPAGGFVK